MSGVDDLKVVVKKVRFESRSDLLEYPDPFKTSYDVPLSESSKTRKDNDPLRHIVSAG